MRDCGGTKRDLVRGALRASRPCRAEHHALGADRLVAATAAQERQFAGMAIAGNSIGLVCDGLDDLSEFEPALGAVEVLRVVLFAAPRADHRLMLPNAE